MQQAAKQAPQEQPQKRIEERAGEREIVERTWMARLRGRQFSVFSFVLGISKHIEH